MYLFFQMIFPFRLLHNIKQSPWYHGVGRLWLSILNIVLWGGGVKMAEE